MDHLVEDGVKENGTVRTPTGACSAAAVVAATVSGYKKGVNIRFLNVHNPSVLTDCESLGTSFSYPNLQHQFFLLL